MAVKPKATKRKRAGDLEAKLDDALDDTFPASDPIAVGGDTSTEPPLRSPDHKAPRIDPADVAAARKGKTPNGA